MIILLNSDSKVVVISIFLFGSLAAHDVGGFFSSRPLKKLGGKEMIIPPIDVCEET